MMFSTQNIHTTSTSSARSWLVGVTMAASVAAFGMFALSAEASTVSRLEAQRAIFTELQEVRTMQQQIIQSRDFSNVDTLRNRIGSISDVLGQVQSNTSPDATFDISQLGSGGTGPWTPAPVPDPDPDTRPVDNLSVSVDGNEATVTFDAPTPCHGYVIEWGDGTETGELNDPIPGTACMQVTEFVEESHQYTSDGEYTISVTVDGDRHSQEVIEIGHARDIDISSLLRQAERFGGVRVIVSLDVEQGDRSAIASEQQNVLDQLANPQNERLFRVTPAFAVGVDADDLRTLATIPSVTDIRQDSPATLH